MVTQDLPERISSESLRTIRGAMSQLREERLGFQSFIDGILDGLEELRVELTSQEKTIQSTRSDLEDKQKELNKALVEAKEASRINTDAQLEIKKLERDLEDSKLQIGRLENDRDDAKARLAAAVEELNAVADALELVQSTERELVETRDELLATREQLRQHEAGPGADEVEKLQREKQQLESDLKQSRAEATRLSDKVAEQRKQLDSQRERMSKDLDGLRAAVQNRVSSLRE